MKYRIAKPYDLSQIVNIHLSTRAVNALGIFAHMGKPFLKQYYKILLNDPDSLFVCAENEQGVIVGYTFTILNNERHQQNLERHKIRLAFGAVSSLFAKPSLFLALYSRYRSIKRQDDRFVHTTGARGGFWGWDPHQKDSESSFELHEKALEIAHVLGVEKLYIEVDVANKQVFKFHKLNGATLQQTIMLPDGRERAMMLYDLTAHKNYTL